MGWWACILQKRRARLTVTSCFKNWNFRRICEANMVKYRWWPSDGLLSRKGERAILSAASCFRKWNIHCTDGPLRTQSDWAWILTWPLTYKFDSGRENCSRGTIAYLSPYILMGDSGVLDMLDSLTLLYLTISWEWLRLLRKRCLWKKRNDIRQWIKPLIQWE